MSALLCGSIIIDSSLHSRRGSSPTQSHSQLKLLANGVRLPISSKWSQTCFKTRSYTGSGCSGRFPTPNATSESENFTSTQNPCIGSKLNQTTPARPLKNFQPGVLVDYFLNYNPQDDAIRHAHKEEIEQLKKKVRNELIAAASPANNDSGRCLTLIDHIQRLGLAYNFEVEIEEVLKSVYETSSNNNYDDLCTVSLRFRLLRQQGFDSSSDVFKKFTDVGGNFKEHLIGDTRGMLSLYEAAHLGKTEGDDILDQALAFTITHLTSAVAADNMNSSDHHAVAEIVQALNIPHWRNLPRLETRRYIPIYEQDVSHNKDLLMLAKLDFNLLQSLHKQELHDVVRWWKELDAERIFPYARSRIVELHFWSQTTMFEPQYRLSRIISTKVNALATVIDDTYDSYGTFEELQLLTTAIERWSFDCVDQLPENLKPVYRLILNTCNEVEQDLARLGRSHHNEHVKRGIKGFVRGGFQAGKWLKEGYVPTMDEYMRNGLLTSGYYFMPVLFAVGMEDVCVTDKALDWCANDTKTVAAGARICRLLNDMASHTREHIPTAVEVYMKQYNVSEKETRDELRRLVDKEWKVHNEEIIRKTAPLPLLNVVLNMSRGVNQLHLDGKDGYSNAGPRMQEVLRLLFIDPVAI